MEQKKFNVGIEIPQGMQEALLGGQGIEGCNVLELVDNFGFLISFFFDKFIC